jgi:hypothetical protein
LTNGQLISTKNAHKKYAQDLTFLAALGSNSAVAILVPDRAALHKVEAFRCENQAHAKQAEEDRVLADRVLADRVAAVWAEGG